MSEPIRFDDGAAYERFMGVWSQRVGTRFLEWIGAPRDAHWIDIGCGNGAFTELVVRDAAPASVVGIDPSPAQLDYARTRFGDTRVPACFEIGDAQSLPVPDARGDVAVMPLVLFFVPDPARGVAEMRRAVKAGGLVTAYVWDMEGGGFPYHALHDTIRAHGGQVPLPPRPEVSNPATLGAMWRDAGLGEVAVETITVTRTFDDFDDYWHTVQGGPSAGQAVRALDDGQRATLRAAVRDQLPAAADGRITVSAWAHAVQGRVLA